MKIKTKLLIFTVIPILLLGCIMIGIVFGSVRNMMVEEIEKSLESTASATLAAYMQNSGKFFKSPNGDIWKGGYNISRSGELVDKIQEVTGMEVTFFYGTERIMTSAKDENGRRLLGNSAGDAIVGKVLEQGGNYFSDNVLLNGKTFYGYFIPVFEKSQEKPVGMIFTGTDKSAKDAMQYGLLKIIIAIIVLVVVICIGIAVWFANSLTAALSEGIDIVCNVAEGRLQENISSAQLKRNDEIGDMARAVNNLRNVLNGIMNKLNEQTAMLLGNSSVLAQVSKHTSNSVTEMQAAIANEVNAAIKQEEHAAATKNNMGIMGAGISDIGDETKVLRQHASSIMESSNVATVLVKDLSAINQKVNEAIQKIAEQTNDTKNTAEAIAKASTFIQMIAGQTNLLSLNASIEAARAGEMGKGFAVVANEVKTLAAQTAEASENIEKIINDLLDNTDKSALMMSEAARVLAEQDSSIAKTDEIFIRVLQGIQISADSITSIAEKMQSLEKTRNDSLQIAEEMDNIAKDNSVSAKKTNTIAAVVADKFTEVGSSAHELDKMASEVAASMKFFEKIPPQTDARSN